MSWVEYTDPSEKVLEAEDLELERRTKEEEEKHGFPEPCMGFQAHRKQRN